MRVEELATGDEVQCWMRSGLAIHLVTTGKGDPYYEVPSKPTVARSGDLTRFVGWVVSNDTVDGVLTLHATPFNSWQMPYGSEKHLVSISYTAFKRLRKFTTVAIEGTEEVPGTMGGKGFRRPGSIAPFGGTAHRAYRKVEEVLL